MINIHSEFYKKLDCDKLQMNQNKNPIEIKLFLSFLTVVVEESHDHLGSCTGWTLYKNDLEKLYISGGKVNGTEYLNNVMRGIKLQNNYNNYVNPFYLFDILTDEGKQFFANYYRQDILQLVEKQNKIVRALLEKTELEKSIYYDYLNEQSWLLKGSL